MTSHPTTVDTRAELIADLRAFADLLERRPDLPVNDYSMVQLQYSVLRRFGDDAARLAEVARVAAILGADVEQDDQHATARLQLGRVEYTVHTMTDLGGAVYDAELSYRGSVAPDMAGAR